MARYTPSQIAEHVTTARKTPEYVARPIGPEMLRCLRDGRTWDGVNEVTVLPLRMLLPGAILGLIIWVPLLIGVLAVTGR